MRRRLYDGARALRPVRDQSAKTIGNSQHRTRQLKLLCHWPCALFSPGSVVDNAANGAVTLRVGSIGSPFSHRPGACTGRPAGGGPLQRRQHLVQGGEEQLSIVRREYQRRADLQDVPFMPVALISPRRWRMPLTTRAVSSGTGVLQARSCTISTPINRPLPRTSPISSCLAARARRPSIISVPTFSGSALMTFRTAWAHGAGHRVAAKESLWWKRYRILSVNPGTTPATSGTNGNTCGRMKPKR
jgi:hypothetical protein